MKFYLLLIAAVSFLTYISCDGCIQCNSKDNERCATNPLSLLNRNCSDGSSDCYSRVLDGYTIRGCAVDLNNATRSTCNNELVCQICYSSAGCNKNIFPMTRAQCLQCSGNSTSSECARDNYSEVKICPIYKFGDQCYIRNSNRTVDGSFQRGCLTSAQSNKQCVKSGNCYVCEGRGCNFLNANDTLIPLARDSGVSVVLSTSLLLAGLLAAWRL
ncbi:uncharacterized protein LOC122319749 isoform X2 [Drosophila ficusphila]|uniref:uncharacterized protein LOC122319749 isoform X2 n=1 Tax=Drosophila ficusphila TaxID=30025 RepID=UPI001C8AE4A3|nr:uncharacterized protein LOC122319749 isoform X2 [Drosophila ficusphila]